MNRQAQLRPRKDFKYKILPQLRLFFLRPGQQMEISIVLNLPYLEMLCKPILSRPNKWKLIKIKIN